MSALQKFTYKGYKVEVWEKSFKIDGMSTVFFANIPVERLAIEQIISTVHEKIKDRAIKEAKAEIVNNFKDLLDEKL